MSGNPSTQTFQVKIVTSMPASILSSNDVVNFLNSAPQGLWDDTIGGALTLDKLIGAGLQGVTSSSVSNVNWTVANGNSTLNFLLNTVSDPITAGDVAAVLEIIVGILLIAASQVFDLIPVVGWAVGIIGAILAFAGALTALSVSVTQVGGAITSNPIFLGGALLVLALGGVVVYSIAKSPKHREELASFTTRGISRAGAIASGLASKAGV